MRATGIVTHLNGTTELVRQSGPPLDGPDGVSVVGGVGSVTLGVSGQKRLDNGFPLLGGAAYFDQSTTGAQSNGAVLSAGGRYIVPDAGQLCRPFFEVGAVLAPSLGMTFGLTYTSPSSTTLATATAGGSSREPIFRSIRSCATIRTRPSGRSLKGTAVV